MGKKKPKRFFIYLCFRVVGFFIYLLPLRIALLIGRCLGKLAFCTLKAEQKRILEHLDIAFGASKTLRQKIFITKGVFENLGQNFVEVISLSKFNSRNIDKYVECSGLQIVNRLIHKGKGGIVLSAHFGNWELLAHYFALKGYSVNVIARRVRNQYFEGFLERLRKRHRVNILHRDASIKDVMSLLKKNEFVGIMPDQDIDSIKGVFVDFFGKPAYTPNGPAILNRLTGASIIPCFIVRKKFGHKVMIEEPIELSKSGDRNKDMLENTIRCSKAIEDYIRKFPSLWVWFHERWKTQVSTKT